MTTSCRRTLRLRGGGWGWGRAMLCWSFARPQRDPSWALFPTTSPDVTRVTLGHLPDRIGGLPVAIGSLAVEAVGQLMVWSANDPLLALAGAFLTGLGCSLVFPSMGREVVHIVEPHLRGTALGAFAAFQDVAYGLTGPVAGLLADRAGYGSIFLMGSAAASVGLLTALHLRRTRPATVKQPA